MTIWTYEDSASADLAHGLGDHCLVDVCAFCQSPLRHLGGDDLLQRIGQRRAPDLVGLGDDLCELRACPVCGWWVSSLLTGRSPYRQHDDGYLNLYRACGTLRDLDLVDLSTPVGELRNYLLARYGDRFSIHPKKYEDIVGGVLADFGFRIRVTQYCNDEGIDLFILDGDGNATVGIQVKRQRGNVKAEQIRAFLGALLLQGLTTGVYVSTSSYQPGAARAAAEARTNLGIAIALVDAPRFFDALKISRLPTLPAPDDPEAPYFARWKRMSAGFPEPMFDGAPLVYGKSW